MLEDDSLKINKFGHLQINKDFIFLFLKRKAGIVRKTNNFLGHTNRKDAFVQALIITVSRRE